MLHRILNHKILPFLDMTALLGLTRLAEKNPSLLTQILDALEIPPIANAIINKQILMVQIFGLDSVAMTKFINDSEFRAQWIAASIQIKEELLQILKQEKGEVSYERYWTEIVEQLKPTLTAICELFNETELDALFALVSHFEPAEQDIALLSDKLENTTLDSSNKIINTHRVKEGIFSRKRKYEGEGSDCAVKMQYMSPSR